jgi:cell division protease FtsH
MSDKMGPIVFGEKEELVFLGKEMGHERNYSETVAYDIDQEVKSLIHSALVKAKEILTEKTNTLSIIAKELIQKETLEQADFYALVK